MHFVITSPIKLKVLRLIGVEAQKTSSIVFRWDVGLNLVNSNNERMRTYSITYDFFNLKLKSSIRCVVVFACFFFGIKTRHETYILVHAANLG